MIGTLTKKFTARGFTLQFRCGLFPLHFCGRVSTHCNVLISARSTPLPTHFHNHRPRRHLLGDLRPWVYAQHVDGLVLSREEKQIGFSLNSPFLKPRERDGVACCWSSCARCLRAVYKYSKVHWILLHIMAV